MKSVVLVAIVGLVGIVGLLLAVGNGMLPSSGQSVSSAEPAVTKPAATGPKALSGGSGLGMAAIAQAAEAKKYLFAFFWRAEDDQTASMTKVLEAAMKKAGDRAQSVRVCITDPAEKKLVDKYGLDRAPMPLVLAIAPNGAIMGGFPTKFTEQALLDAFSSPCTERCMKQLQDGKLVLVCVQNSKTKSNDEALKGVREFKADSRFASATEIVMLDPADSADKPFLADLKIDPAEPEA